MMKKLKAKQNLFCAGKKIKEGATFECDDKDARVLVAYKQAEYVDKEDAKVEKGLSTKTASALTGKEK